MIESTELVQVICELLRMIDGPIPVSLTDHPPATAQQIIVSVLEEAQRGGVIVPAVRIDPALAAEIGKADGTPVTDKSNAVFSVCDGLGRQVVFEHLPAVKLN